MALETCKCGCTIFETIRTYQYEQGDFVVDSRSTTIPVEVNVIPIARCIQCSRLKVPGTSLPGMTYLDPRVKAYQALVVAAETWNKKLDAFPPVLDIIDRQVVDMQNVLDRLGSLENKACACGDKNVETTTGSRKKSKASVS